MPTRYMQPTARILTLSFVVFVFLNLFAAQTAQAQRNRSTPNPRGRINEDALRTWSRDNMAQQADKVFAKQRIPLLPQVKNDFARMQHINNEMMRDIFVVNRLDYKNILDTTAEIRKRANRLKANLRLFTPEGEEKPRELPAGFDNSKLKESLLLLDNSIMSFVTNPLFQKTEVLDAKLSARASRDLQAIIEMSAAIRKTVERLQKSSAPQKSAVNNSSQD